MKILNPILLPVRVGKADNKVNDNDDRPLLTINVRYRGMYPEAQRQVVDAINNFAMLREALLDVCVAAESPTNDRNITAVTRLAECLAIACAALNKLERNQRNPT